MLEKFYPEIAYNALRMEGVDISITSIIDLINDIDITNTKDIDKSISKNFIQALSYVNSIINSKFDKYEIVEIIKTINYYVLKSLHSYAGRIRDNFIYVSGSNYIPEAKSEFKIQNEIMDNIDDYIKNPLKLYCYITRNQIFSDGNKRTALLVVNLLLQLKDDSSYFSIPIERKPEYDKLLIEYYESNNESDFIKYLNQFIKSTGLNDKIIDWS